MTTLAHHTFRPWRTRGDARIVAAEAAWKEPLKWEKRAQTAFIAARMAGEPAPERPRVFCASLADVFEDWQGPITTASGRHARKRFDGSWITDGTGGITRDDFPLTMRDVRLRLFALIDATPNLDWLILTKRPENIAKMMPAYHPCGRDGCEVLHVRPNLWLGTSVENQQAADERIPHLLSVPAAVRFLSCEPLLEEVSLRRAVPCGECGYRDTENGYGCFNGNECEDETWIREAGLHWVIVGGESGHGARPCNVEWIRSIRDQCRAAGVSCFVKQLGARPDSKMVPLQIAVDDWKDYPEILTPLIDKKGGDMAEWPNDLRVREFPKVGSYTVTG